MRQPGKAAGSTPVKAGASRAATATATEWNIQLAKVADELDAVIGKCVLAAEVETVHRLRTGSRRVQATVETMLRQAGRAGRSLEKPAKAWLRSIGNIRRAAGPVRDLDVHRKLLEKSQADWAKEAAPANPGTPPATNEQGNASEAIGAGNAAAGNAAQGSGDDANPLNKQAKELDDWLKDSRHAHAESLRKKVKKAREKLEQRRAAFQSALQRVPSLAAKPLRSPGLVALEDFVRVVDAMPLLDSGNLHDFRKLTKKARYVAESGEEPSSKSIAKALKRVQDAIGDWHDWQSLAEEAKLALKDGDELTAWLQGQVDEFLAAGLRITERVRGQLLGEWMAAKSERRARKEPGMMPKPPARAAQTRRFRSPRTTSRVA